MISLRSRWLLIVCGLALCGAVLCVAATEVAYRVARTTVCVGRDAGSLLATHSDYGWKHLSNASAWIYGCDGREYEFRNLVTTNSNGLRDREIAYEKPASTLRVLLLGDTITEAIQVPLEQSFAKLTESQLRRDLGNVEVINAGCASYGTDNELLFFRDEGIRYDADLVVLVLSTRNDAIDVSASLHPRTLLAERLPPKTYFLLDGAGELVRPAPPEARKVEQLSGLESDSGGGIWSLIRSNLYLVRALERGLSTQSEQPNQPPKTNEPTVNWQAVYERPMGEEIVRGWLVVERLIAALDADVRASGAQLLVAIMPGREEVLAAGPAATRPPMAVHPDQWDLDSANRTVRAMLDRLGVAYLDLLPPFRSHIESTGSSGFYAVDVHLAPEGHRIVAGELVSRLTPLLGRLRDP